MANANAIFNRVYEKFQKDWEQHIPNMDPRSVSTILAACIIAEALRNSLDESEVSK